MKRFWTALAVALLTIFTGAGCNDYGNTFQNNTGAFLAFLSPSQIPAGTPQFTLTLTGAGFVAKTKVQWNGKNLLTTVPTDSSGNVLGNMVTAVVPAALIATPGTVSVNTLNPASGAGQNGLSNPVTFIINNPPNLVPTVSSVAPACAVVGNALPITVTGTNFLNSSTDKTQVSTMNWTLGSSQFQFTTPAASITSTQITVTIPATAIGSVPGTTAAVTAYNPPSPPLPNVPGSTGSGGGTSIPSAGSTVTVSSACPVAAQAGAKSDATAAVTEEAPAVSLDGRYVAYAAMQNEHSQIFLRDTCEGAPAGCQPRTTLLSVATDGDPASADSHSPPSVRPRRISSKLRRRAARFICATLVPAPPIPASPRPFLFPRIRAARSSVRRASCLRSVPRDASSRFSLSPRAMPRIKLRRNQNPRPA
ncbi:MAG: hypothetical protein AUH86_00710 [Acidobacteria bacterium 13_1_40CM_4_58_4]|nr:MAG: hypothetical protein AUH86_00710 [Acidobacteria bacterium 13_1_40CM_4_58_4]